MNASPGSDPVCCEHLSSKEESPTRFPSQGQRQVHREDSRTRRGRASPSPQDALPTDVTGLCAGPTTLLENLKLHKPEQTGL